MSEVQTDSRSAQRLRQGQVLEQNGGAVVVRVWERRWTEFPQAPSAVRSGHLQQRLVLENSRLEVVCAPDERTEQSSLRVGLRHVTRK